MTFAQAGVDTNLVKALVTMVDSGKIPHAIMVHEEDGGKAFALSQAFLQYLYCSDRKDGDSCALCSKCNKISKMIHPDVHFIYPTTSKDLSFNYIAKFRELASANPYFTESELFEALGVEGKTSIIAVSEAKALSDKLSLRSLEGGYTSAVILYPEYMRPDAANKLLKLIEEPPALTQFIFITHAPEKVLVTIRSRCQHISLKPEKKAAIQSNEELDALLCPLMDAVVARNLFAALEASDAVAALPSRENMKAFCAYSLGRLRDVFLLQQGMGSIVSADQQVQRWSKALPKTFVRKAADIFGRAQMLIGRNVNAKIIFTDLSNRLFKLI